MSGGPASAGLSACSPSGLTFSYTLSPLGPLGEGGSARSERGGGEEVVYKGAVAIPGVVSMAGCIGRI